MTHPNLEMLRIAVENLGELANEMVFGGGCETGNGMAKEKFPAILIYQSETERKNSTR